MSLREYMQGAMPVTAPLVLNPLMARMAESAGFSAGYLGGGATGYQKVVLEANLNVTEMCQAAVDIRAVSSLPLIFDGACGFGDPMHMHRTIGMSEAAGFEAIEIEDQLLPKRAHHHVGIEHMIPMELMAAKIGEAVAARRNPEFLIIGRTNAMRASTMDDALRRGEAYREAGADLVLLSMANKPEQLRLIAERLGGPLMYLAGRGGLAGLGMTPQRSRRPRLHDRRRSVHAAAGRLRGVEEALRGSGQRLRQRPGPDRLVAGRARDAGRHRPREAARSRARHRGEGQGRVSRRSHIKLTSHPGGAPHRAHRAGAPPSPKIRGPLIAVDLRHPSTATSSARTPARTPSTARWRWPPARSTACASPTSPTPRPTDRVGPHPQWSDPEPHRLARSVRRRGRRGLRGVPRPGLRHPPDHRHHQGAHRRARDPAAPSRPAACSPDGVDPARLAATAVVTKAAIEPVWYLPGVAKRFGCTEAELRRTLFEQTGGMFPELVDARRPGGVPAAHRRPDRLHVRRRATSSPIPPCR